MSNNRVFVVVVAVCSLWAFTYMYADNRMDDTTLTPRGFSEVNEAGLTFYKASGVANRKVRGKRRSPILVTDTATIINGYATIALNKYVRRGLISTVPSSADDIHVLGIVPILEGLQRFVWGYGFWINTERDEITIKSTEGSLGADTTVVQVSFIIQ